jgi:hypothetical protein
MVINKKGQLVLVEIMLCIVFFIAAVIMIQPINENVIIARNDTALNCSTTTDAYNEATCKIMDFGAFYMICVGLAVGLAFLTGKKTLTGILTAIFTYIIVVFLITPLKDIIMIARDADHLNCIGTGLTTGTKLSCIFIDMWLFYFVIAAIGAAVTYIVLKET